MAASATGAESFCPSTLDVLSLAKILRRASKAVADSDPPAGLVTPAPGVDAVLAAGDTARVVVMLAVAPVRVVAVAVAISVVLVIFAVGCKTKSRGLVRGGVRSAVSPKCFGGGFLPME